jgi:hypothetical protein
MKQKFFAELFFKKATACLPAARQRVWGFFGGMLSAK